MKFSAQTAEQAIEKGLQELGKTREEVEIVIVSEGKKGFLGIFGGKPAEVEITPKETERVEEKAETVAEPESSDEKKGAESEQEVEQAHIWLKLRKKWALKLKSKLRSSAATFFIISAPIRKDF